MVTVTVLDEGRELRIPHWVTDIHSFRSWSDTDDFPKDTCIWWLKGDVWAQMSKEQAFTHVLVKTKIAAALTQLADDQQLGLFFGDGLLLSNFEADISGNPDGLFLSNATLASDRVRLIEGKTGGCVEIQGSPDMVLEVLSDSSVNKDEVVLKAAYWEAGVREYWLVDARGGELRFDILRRGPKAFVTTRKRDGWVKSIVFGRSFRLLPRQTPTKHPSYLLEVR